MTMERYRSITQDRRVVFVRGAGDIATGSICRLHEVGFLVVAAEIDQPTMIRRTVALGQAMVDGEARVEGLTALRCEKTDEVSDALEVGAIPILADPTASSIDVLHPDAVVDAILAKRNLGTTRDMARAVVALGPGFSAGEDCDAVVETMRGHDLGRVIYEGPALPNTGIPGNIAGFASERVVHAPAAGIIELAHDIGDHVEAGELIAEIGAVAVAAPITGVLRGIIADGTDVSKGLKIADVDPRDDRAACFTVSDKARSVGGGTLEAVMHLLACRM